jgi:hypothetical protein
MVYVPTDAEGKLNAILTNLLEKNRLFEKFKKYVGFCVIIMDLLQTRINNLLARPGGPVGPGDQEIIDGQREEIERLRRLIDRIGNELKKYNPEKKANNDLIDFIIATRNDNPDIDFDAPGIPSIADLQAEKEAVPVIGGRRRSIKQKKGKRRGTMKRGGWVLKGSKY